MFKNLDKNRWISGTIIGIVIIVTAAVGGYLQLALCLAIAILGSKELLTVLGLEKSPLTKAVYVLEILYFLMLPFFHYKAIAMFLFLTLLVCALILMKQFPAIPLSDAAAALFCFAYVAVGISFLYFSRIKHGGIWILLLIYGASLLGDVFGYIVGKRFGKHKMTPVLSPHKTFEGLAGEVAGVTVVALIYGLIAKNSLSAYYNAPVFTCVMAGFFGCLVSVAGDLFASAIKRQYGIKDYSNLIPGHGGIMDRVDSVLFAAPLVTFIFLIVEI